MNGYYSKKLQQSKRYKELQENIQLYYEYSLEKEHKQKSYLNSHRFINSKTGECVNIKYDFEQKHKEYSKVVYQRALSIQEHAKREFEGQGMASAFITLTLPSQYYSFKSVKTKKGRLYVSENEEFVFDSLKESVTARYKELQKIYQTFYKRVKNLTDIKYIKSVEFSKQMVPHIHLVLFFPFDKLDHVRGTFKRVVEHFNLDRTDFQEVSFKANLNNAAKYLLKYITKGFDSPDIELNPKLVYPALSCVCFKSEKPNWDNFKDAFSLNIHALSQPYFNTNENVFYFTMQKREKVKWVRTTRLKDQTWALIAMHYDESSKLLFIGCSDKRFDIDLLAEKVSENTSERITGDDVFRSFDSIKRLSLVHAGIFKPANHLHRYSRLSGADVTDELTRWKEGNKVKKSDFVGVGFRDGFPVSVGASVKGKIWSPARVGDLKEWKEWCIKIGKLVTNKEIDTDQLLEDSAKKIQLEEYPKDINILATDWSEELYDRIHKLTFEMPSRDSFMLSEGTIKCNNIDGTKAEFILNIFDESISFSIILGGENGHSIIGLDNSKITVEGLKSNPIPLKQFFQENPPTMFLLNGCTIAGSIHTDYSESGILTIPNEQMKTLDWKDVDYKIESLYKGKDTRENSIQEYMMKKLIDRGANIVFNDDNSGESADIVGIFKEDELIRFEMIHCKYSKEKSGARLSDLYEVCGQAVVSLRYKWKPEELLKHLERRNATGVLAGKRFYHGDTSDISEIKKALKYCNVEFEFAIAQPGVEKSSLNQEMKDFLGSIYSTVIEMTETKLCCYFNN